MSVTIWRPETAAFACCLCQPTLAFPNPMEKVWLKLSRELLTQHPYGTRWSDCKDLITRWFDHHRQGSADLLHEVGLLPLED